jgi:hypothetical protein
MSWVAIVRDRGESVLLNLSPNKADVIEDAKLNTRIAVRKAESADLDIWAMDAYKNVRHIVRARYGLPGALPQEVLPFPEDVDWDACPTHNTTCVWCDRHINIVWGTERVCPQCRTL